jgi:excisionase family DNA binding protein
MTEATNGRTYRIAPRPRGRLTSVAPESGLAHPSAHQAPSPTLTSAPVARPLMLGVAEACGILGVGRTTLWAMVRDGEIGAVKRGARLQFPLVIVEEYVSRQAERAREQAERRRLAARAPRR